MPSRPPHASPRGVTAGIFRLHLRDDLPREVTTEHWAVDHAALVSAGLPHAGQYTQLQFDPKATGCWPEARRVGVTIPDAGRLDGIAELVFARTADALRSAGGTPEIARDEQNAFRQIVGQLTGPGRGRVWDAASPPKGFHHVVVFLRRRGGVSRRAFTSFVHDELGAALHAGGAKDLRTHTFIPSAKFANRSPGVAHHHPQPDRFHGVLIFATPDPDARGLLASVALAGPLGRQSDALSAAHGYTVERYDRVVDRLGADR